MTIVTKANRLWTQVRFLKTIRGRLSKGTFSMGDVKIG